MIPVFHPEAEAELNAAIDWYEARAPGLGAAFSDEVRAAVGRAQAFPHAWQAQAAHANAWRLRHAIFRDVQQIILLYRRRRDPD